MNEHMKIQLPPTNVSYPMLWRGVGDERASVARKAADERLQAMQEALKRLKQMPSPQALAKQSATNRVGMLKQRLEALKAMLLHATPEQAKALARELKDIARELAAAARELGGSGGQGKISSADNPGPGADGGKASEAAASSTPAAGSGAETTAASSADVNQEASNSDASTSGNAHETKADAESTGVPNSGSSAASDKGTAPDGDDQALKNALIEAKKLLKEVIAMVKAKLAEGAREARHDVLSAEKSLADIDAAIARDDSDVAYSALGNPGSAISASDLPEASASSGLNINVTV